MPDDRRRIQVRTVSRCMRITYDSHVEPVRGRESHVVSTQKSVAQPVITTSSTSRPRSSGLQPRLQKSIAPGFLQAFVGRTDTEHGENLPFLRIAREALSGISVLDIHHQLPDPERLGKRVDPLHDRVGLVPGRISPETSDLHIHDQKRPHDGCGWRMHVNHVAAIDGKCKRARHPRAGRRAPARGPIKPVDEN